MSAFEELGVMPELAKAVEDLGWLLPSPVQAETIPLILGGGDVMAAAETGSGKTGVSAGAGVTGLAFGPVAPHRCSMYGNLQ
ncbi:putative ATP-dependent RNA helicase [Tetrabaena socialis]|uniref:Putative ATP-dependent RNA helicase n=1 Tax=Tetrabaena socialis TaxID=47790 RepID=A0A2J7ZLS1_9CHLO|nr:putative ATP-dependent RNA helicase [Tetrabaena socialis]|eukprot:PNH01212.1 putative ATP-dependent RNA helicase [Tetrabaena socialis]